jgi:predicted NAD/FAD-dependent oxidoreductase
MSEGLVTEWSRGFPGPDGAVTEAGAKGGPEVSGGSIDPPGRPRYRCATGMTTVPKRLAQGVQVRCGERVVQVRASHDGWRLETETGVGAGGSALILTCPVPQGLTLLDAAGTRLDPNTEAALRRIDYDPCLTLLAVLDGPSGLPAPGALQLGEEPISWIADNRMKGISPEIHGVTIHAGRSFSRERWDRPEEETVEMLLDRAGSHLERLPISWQLHRWRYAQASVLHPDPCLVTHAPAPLAFAGDAFGGPKIEGAALSGLAAAAALLRRPG